MKKISNKLLKKTMDQAFLSYGYQVASLTHDYMVEKIDIERCPDYTDDQREKILDGLRNDFNQRVLNASKKFHKGIALWAHLYENKAITPEYEIIY